MGAAVGTQVAVGIGEETTYGTPVAPTKWLEILSESLRFVPTNLESQGLRRGTRNLRRGSRRTRSARAAEGQINLEVPSTGFDLIWEHLLGGGTGPWTMGSLQGKSLTVQKILADDALTTIDAFTYHGGKITQAQFSLSVDQILQVALDMDFEDEDRAGDGGTAAGTPTYGSEELLNFLGATLTVGGSAMANVLSFQLSIANNLNTSRYYLGSGGLKAEPLSNDFPAVTGQFVAEFLDPDDWYATFEADTGVALNLDFADTAGNTVDIDVPEIRLDGETPQVSGPQVVEATVAFTGFYDGTNPGVTITHTAA